MSSHNPWGMTQEEVLRWAAKGLEHARRATDRREPATGEPGPAGTRPEASAEQAAQQADARDAARLDWLEQHSEQFYNLDRVTSIVGYGFRTKGAPWSRSLRAAIDAAMAASKKEG